MKRMEIICCPKCKGVLKVSGCNDLKNKPTKFFCDFCGENYPVVEGVIDLFPENKVTKGRGQKLMEWQRMVNIYESKYWRNCSLFSLFMGLTLAEEIALIKHITHPGINDTILDLACGTGIYARAFARDNPCRNVFGLDISWPMLRYATNKAMQMGIENIQFIHGDAHILPFTDKSLNVANCCGALHLFSDARQVLNELHRAIRPGGRLSLAMAWRGERSWSHFKAYADGRFWNIHYFSKDELCSLLNEAGFSPAIYHSYGIWMIAGGVRR
jgi:ubiquinone/menaquinone biosynthesis C-methylase UbiE